MQPSSDPRPEPESQRPLHESALPAPIIEHAHSTVDCIGSVDLHSLYVSPPQSVRAFLYGSVRYRGQGNDFALLLVEGLPPFPEQFPARDLSEQVCQALSFPKCDAVMVAKEALEKTFARQDIFDSPECLGRCFARANAVTASGLFALKQQPDPIWGGTSAAIVAVVESEIRIATCGFTSVALDWQPDVRRAPAMVRSGAAISFMARLAQLEQRTVGELQWERPEHAVERLMDLRAAVNAARTECFNGTGEGTFPLITGQLDFGPVPETVIVKRADLRRLALFHSGLLPAHVALSPYTAHDHLFSNQDARQNLSDAYLRTAMQRGNNGTFEQESRAFLIDFLRG